MPPTPQPEDAEAVDHRRVRVGPDERVGERDAVPLVDDACEELEVHLVDDPGARRDDLEVVEGVLPPAEEGVALAVPLELELGVADDREAVRELVHLNRVVDDELDREERIDLLRVAAEVVHRVPQRGEVDDRRDPGEVLQQHPARRERDLVRRLGARHPAGDGLDVGRRDTDAVLHPQRVLEEDPERVRQPPDVMARLERVDAEDLARLSRDLERRTRTERVGMGHLLRFKQLAPVEPTEAALRERRSRTVELPSDRLCVRSPDAARVGGESLVPERAQVLRVGIEQVLAADLSSGVEEREADPERDLEQRATLTFSLGEEPAVRRGELRRRGEAQRV